MAASHWRALSLRQTAEDMGALYKTRPYFGIMSMYTDKIYLVVGGVLLAVGG